MDFMFTDIQPILALAWVPIILGIISALGTAYGAYSQSEAQKQAADVAKKNADYQREQSELNAKNAAEMAKNKADAEAMQRGMEREEQKKDQKRRRALMEAAYATSGVLLDGTPSNYLSSQAETDELNVQRLDQASDEKQKAFLYQGLLDSTKMRNQGEFQATQFDQKAAALESAANTTLIAGGISAIGDIGGGIMKGLSATKPAGGFSWQKGGGMGITGSTGMKFTGLGGGK